MNNTIQYQLQGLTTTGAKDVIEVFEAFAEASREFASILQAHRQLGMYDAIRITRTVKALVDGSYVFRDLEVLQYSDI